MQGIHELPVQGNINITTREAMNCRTDAIDQLPLLQSFAPEPEGMGSGHSAAMFPVGEAKKTVWIQGQL